MVTNVVGVVILLWYMSVVFQLSVTSLCCICDCMMSWSCDCDVAFVFCAEGELITDTDGLIKLLRTSCGKKQNVLKDSRCGVMKSFLYVTNDVNPPVTHWYLQRLRRARTPPPVTVCARLPTRESNGFGLGDSARLVVSPLLVMLAPT